MTNQIHPFQLGAFKLMAISDGAFPVTRDFFFAETPDELIQHIPTQFRAPLNFLLIDSGDKKVLVDTGLGYEHSPTAGKLLSNLKAAGIDPEDIQTVIITHAHLDHTGGMLTNGKPTFPHAQYIMHKEEWDVWTSQPDSNEYKQLLPLKNQIKLLTENKEILPGIRLIHTPGHTAGHLSLSIFSEGEHLMLASDILNYPTTLEHLPSHIRAEQTPTQALETRKKFLEEASSKSALLFVCHYPFPGLGRIERTNKGWKWIPVLVQ
ncbi:MBL fold metallo-hydrolase [Halalkalibacter sp. APA_J-10(15)]|uniref:MBL fold metallo-hydrolase n=1 Tax=unclassified Halalkalibacter TaxID=2893063 RepID=UPI001FF39BE1|nr:MBL fold metallo-hydrolase [Halalkalibacter sp. APA_J-10(15)]MCK0470478.1 MBL fold metallo-hydrolase [Halalkalibacter sp. APA_J-10(15)]